VSARVDQRWAAVQDWAIGIDRRTGSLKVLGVVLALLAVTAVAVVFALFRGVFTAYDAISVRLPASSTAALPGSAVQYRDVSIGKVVGQGRAVGDGTTVVSVHVDPGKLASIPASVRAAVTPISVFGNQYVVLEPPADPGTAVLRPGATVQARQDAPTSSVQQTVTSLNRLLVALHPAQLNSALTAVAQALQGQGQQLGQTADQAGAYLAALQPLWPTVVQDLGLLAPVADGIAAATPDLVGLLGNSLTTSATITGNAGPLHQLLTGSSAFADQAEQLSTAAEKPFSLLAAASGPFLEAVAGRPDNISRLLEGLDGFANAVVQAGRAGPFLSVTADVQVLNAANLATAALGGPPAEMVEQLRQGLGSALVDPPTYTSAQRPTFAAVTAPAAPTTPAALPAAAVVPVLPAADVRTAVSAITAAISGAQPGSADAAALLLAPLLAALGQP
jgi:phospholipid/cholesterol/gamma-HCH transport system substrate-binding protein